MNKQRKAVILFLRLSMGFLMFYAGITKVFDSSWSAAGYLSNAQTFPALYEWFASPVILPFVNILNAWGLTIVGLCLILGLYTRAASWVGIALMILYYFPVLNFPYAGDHGYIFDDHIIYALVFYSLIQFRAGNRWSIDAVRSKR